MLTRDKNAVVTGTEIERTYVLRRTRDKYLSRAMCVDIAAWPMIIAKWVNSFLTALLDNSLIECEVISGPELLQLFIGFDNVICSKITNN